MSNDLFRIVYRSRVPHGGDGGETDLDPILAASRRNNAREGVTGALLYTFGTFVQVLEGPLEAVQRLFERIQHDRRHDEIVLLQAESVAHRLFGEWSMALASGIDPVGTNTVLRSALAQPNGEATLDVLTLLDILVRREPMWVPMAARM